MPAATVGVGSDKESPVIDAMCEVIENVIWTICNLNIMGAIFSPDLFN